jgi:putative superfamily III holin-X
MTGDLREPRRRSLFSLIADVPTLLADLVRNEIELLKQEITAKIKHAGIGLGLLAGAGAFAFFTIGVLTAAAILGLAEVIPAWAAALIIGGGLLLITLILLLIGVGQLKRATPTPTETITSVKKDVNAIKGIGKRAQS